MDNKTAELKRKIDAAEALVIGTGSGLSTAAGFVYGGQRFNDYFTDFEDKYGFHDMYSGVFYPYSTEEEYWGYFSRLIYINRYVMPPNSVYGDLYELVKDKNYFILTTNVDHCFQRHGFDKDRLFYTQGDYGLWQCSVPCHADTYDNMEQVTKHLLSTDFLEKTEGNFIITPKERWKMTIPSELIPKCPQCGKPMTMNLRGDDRFVEDAGWHKASKRYSDFLKNHTDKNILFIEIGVGMNTPGIIKYPFWQMTARLKNASYVCINKGQAVVPREIVKKSVCIDADIQSVLKCLQDMV